MNRLGWLLLLIFIGLAVAFGFMLAKGEAERRPPPVQSFARVLPRQEPVVRGLAVPVAGVPIAALDDSWGDARGGRTRRHQAIDIMAARGTPVVAAAPGRVEKLFDSRDGGRTIYILSPDGGTVYYYAHLDGYRPGLAEGQQVRTGEVIGAVGATGSASQAGPHLHFEVKRMAAGERWYQGREVNPYPLLAGPAAGR